MWSVLHDNNKLADRESVILEMPCNKRRKMLKIKMKIQASSASSRDSTTLIGILINPLFTNLTHHSLP